MNLELHPLCTLLRDMFFYEQEFGHLVRTVTTSSRAKVGAIAGYEDRHGHLRVRFNGKEYAVHRLVWLYVTGNFPEGEIDHINGIRSDNRFSNLRDVPHRTNMENRKKAAAHNISGVLGVTKRGDSYMARIKINGKQVILGSFASASDAHVNYLIAKRQSHDGCTL